MSKALSTLLSCLLFLGASAAAAAEPVLTVDWLVKQALEQNPEIAAARMRSAAARERVPQAGALDDPMLGLGVINLPSDFDFNQEDMTMKEISASQKFPFPGKRGLMREAARKEAEEVSHQAEQTANEVAKNVKLAFYDLSHVYRATEVTRRTKEILEQYALISRTRYSVGQGAQEDVIRAQVDISMMVNELIMLEQKRKALEARINSLIRRPSDSPLGAPEEIVFQPAVFSIEGIQQQALGQNPSLKAMEKKIDSRRKNIALANKDYLPDFNVRFAYGQRESRLDTYTGVVEINLPIFQDVKQDRRVAEALAELRAEEAGYEAAANELLYQVADAGANAQRLARQIELYRTGIIAQSELQIQATLSAYMVNRADFMALLDSRTRLYRYELEYHEALTEYEKSLALLEAAAGGALGGEEVQP